MPFLDCTNKIIISRKIQKQVEKASYFLHSAKSWFTYQYHLCLVKHFYQYCFCIILNVYCYNDCQYHKHCKYAAKDTSTLVMCHREKMILFLFSK